MPRMLYAAFALAAALAAPAIAAAQLLPQGYATDDPAAPTETAASQAPQAQPTQDQVDQGDVAADPQDEYADTDPSALTEFRAPLAAHGTWVEDPTYGTVWVPAADAVGPDFAPYVTAGHWAMTDDGEWLWVSDYEWGYIPFHYGRWIWIPAYGWSWIPGRVYAPAWVVWRTGDYGYVGWAPMPPAFYWSSGVAVTFWMVPTAAYVFCPTTYVFHHHVHTYVVHDRTTVHRVAAHTHPYRPAHPTGGRPERHGAQGAGGRPYRPASPSLQDARIPPSGAPKARVSADPRALAYSRPSTTPAARSMSPAARGVQAAPGRGASAGRRTLPGGQAPQARPRLPGAQRGDAARPGAGVRRPGDFDRSARTPRSQAPVIRTPSHRPSASPPSQMPQRVHPGPRPRVHPGPSPRGHPGPSPRVSPPRATPAPRSAPAPRAKVPSSTKRSTPKIIKKK
ncbi:MAG: hypothetical protein IT372_30705 [Polyangiaceae bacterium]|nr:hypothetical protein [Polyangiaceae bacterium]